MTSEGLTYILPDQFRYSVKEVLDKGSIIYAELKTAEDCDAWISEFSQLNSTAWIVRRTKPASIRILCRLVDILGVIIYIYFVLAIHYPCLLIQGDQIRMALGYISKSSNHSF